MRAISRRSGLVLIFLTSAFFVLLTATSGEYSRGLHSPVPRWVASTRPESVASEMPSAASRVVSFETTEGTFMNVDVAPSGEELIFDLLGDVYSLPITGGEPVPLTSGRAWDQAPRFSPDGRIIYLVSDRKGAKNVWRLLVSDQSLQQVTNSDSDVVGTPNWSQDRHRLLVGRVNSDDGEVVLQSIDPISGMMAPIGAPSGPWIDLDSFEILRSRSAVYSAVQSTDGKVFFTDGQFDQEQGRFSVLLYSFDSETRTRTAITPAEATYSDYKPQLSHDGELLAYFRQYSDRRVEVRIRNRTTGRDEALIELSNADDARYSPADESRPNYAFTPDDRHLVFWHGGRIHRISLIDGSSRIIPFRVKVEREVWMRAEPSVRHIDRTGEATVIRWPSVSLDGETMAFAAIGYIWIMNLTTGEVRRLTDSEDLEYMPNISSDGHDVAYVSFTRSGDDYGSGRLMVAGVDGGTPREVLAARGETYLLPNWSQDSERIAVIREVKAETGSKAAFGWTRAAHGAFQEVASAPTSNDRSSWYVYARFVGFDDAGNHLLFSFPTTRSETVLAAAGVDGSEYRRLAIGASEVGGITPAPNLKNLVLTRRDGTVWIVPFDPNFERRQVSTESPDARRISDGGGYYVDWNHPEQITFGFGPNVYRHTLDRGRTESLHVKLTYDKQGSRQPIAFTGARLITIAGDDGADPVIETGTVVVSGQRIVAIGPAREVVIPSDALVIDATGDTIMPGLLDTHYHRIGGDNLSAFALPNPSFSDRSAITYGVTTAWEPGGAVNDGVPATVDLQAAGRISGPRWSHAVEGRVGYPWESLASYAAALGAVDRPRQLGVAVLKEYNTPTRQQRQWLSAAARERGLGIVSHIQSFEGMMTRIVDGYTGGDHSYIPVPFFKDVRELMRQTGYIWTPNIMITSGSLGQSDDVRRYYWRALERRPVELQLPRSAAPADSVNRASVPYSIHRVSRVAEQAASAVKAGIRIGVSAHNMPGARLHGEMWYLWKGGLSAEDVLRAVTIDNAAKLGLQEEVGSLEVGKIADFLILDDNPLEDIINTLSIKYTVMSGAVYESDTAELVDLPAMQETDTAAVHSRDRQ